MSSSTPALVDTDQAKQVFPLTWARIAYWRSRRLSERAGARELAFAVRLRGPIDIDGMRRSCHAVIERHDALRTRFVRIKDAPMQVVEAASAVELEIVDI